MRPDKRPPTDFPLILDAHCHLGTFRNFHIPENGIDGMMQALDAIGVDIAIVAAHAGISSDFRLGNDLALAAAKAHPGRVFGYCCVNPNYPTVAREELERCFAHPAFRGIKVHPELHGDYPLDGRGYRAMWEFAAERAIPLLSHTYFNGDRIEVFVKLAKRYPSVPILVGHAAIDHGLDRVIDAVLPHPNLHLDLTGPSAFEGVVERLVAEVGASRLLFGSDIPFTNAPLQLGGILHAQIPRGDKELILGRNAARLFGLDGEDTP